MCFCLLYPLLLVWPHGTGNHSGCLIYRWCVKGYILCSLSYPPFHLCGKVLIMIWIAPGNWIKRILLLPCFVLFFEGGSYYVAKAGLEVLSPSDLPTSASQMLILEACTTTPTFLPLILSICLEWWLEKLRKEGNKFEANLSWPFFIVCVCLILIAIVTSRICLSSFIKLKCLPCENKHNSYKHGTIILEF